MSAILELKETPKSCMECQLMHETDSSTGSNFYTCQASNDYNDVERFSKTRHPDCPLKITKDNLRWKSEGSWENHNEYFVCPACEHGLDFEGNYCPSCGIKLLPPEEK